jgi:ataxia telangiectasia mutated family protein
LAASSPLEVRGSYGGRNEITNRRTRYHPSDFKPSEIDGALRKKQKEEGAKPEDMLNLFLDYRKRFKPVMRHFFTEKHKTPMSWFSMRLSYTRSVAVTSIVGHIIGLGDRHCSNILIDNNTGDIIHIDLGIAFEQASRLMFPYIGRFLTYAPRARHFRSRSVYLFD